MLRSTYLVAPFNLVIMLMSVSAFSQNLITNGGFEDIPYCPNSASELVYASPWFTPTNATPDLFNECATDDDFGVPVNYFGFQEAHSGAGYAGGFWLIANTPYREYIASPLAAPMEAGKIYSVSFYINVVELYCSVNHCGAYFSVAQPDQNNVDVMLVTPQISYLGGYLNNTTDWVKISGCYEAEGGEQYITIGNFVPTVNSPLDPSCPEALHSYYLIDDVVVLGLPDLDFQGPIAACDHYLIDPGITGVDFLWSDGSTDPTLLVTQSGIYSVTISTDCASETAEVEVIIHDPAFVELGPDAITLCEGESYTIHLEPAIYDYEWQDGTTGPDYSISNAGLYQVTMNDGCVMTSDQILFAIDIVPPASILGEDVSLCPGDFLEFDFDPTYGEYVWQDGTPSPIYSIYDPGHYALTISNVCGQFVDDLNVVAIQPPNFDLGPDTTLICEGTSLNILLDPHLGDFVWQDGSDMNNFSITGPGIYSVTVSNDCGIASQNMLVGWADTLASFDLGPDLHLCPGDHVVLSPGVLDADYVWQDMSTADSLRIDIGGIYFVQVSNVCTTISDTVLVTFDADAPDLHLPDQLNLCQGDSVTLDAIINGVSYLWNDNSQASTLIVSSSGNYSLTVSNSCGTDVDTVVVLDAGPTPSVSLGNDIQLCPSDEVSLTPVSSDVTSWIWGDGSTADSYSVNGDELVTVEVSNSCGVSYDTLIATLLPATPSIDLGADTSLCPGNTLLLTVNTPNVTVEWSDGSINNQFLVNGPGNYYATISTSCGENTDTVHVDVLPPPPALNLGMDQSLCPGEIITLSPGINNVNYLWQDGSNSNSFNATQAGLIILTISNSCGAATDSLLIVISNNGPDVNLGSDVLACEGDVVLLMSDISGVNYLWQDGSTASSLSTSSSGLYYLQVSNNCGVDIDSVNVEINGFAPDTDLGADTVLCEGTVFTLNASSDPTTDHLWQDGSDFNSFLVHSPGTYSLTEANHCGADSDTIHIEYVSPPDPFSLGPDTTLCPGEFILLNTTATNTTILWQDGSDDPFMIADQAQTYSLVLSNGCGNEKDEMMLSFDTDLPKIVFDSVSSLCPGKVITLDATQLFPVTYLWNTGSNDPVLITDVPGNYSVLIQTLCNDVEGNASVVMSDTCFADNSFFIPNVFSPNGDNINDVFSINLSDGIEVHSMQAVIFDRWGNMVFQSSTIPIEWNGDFDGTSLNPGVYVYRIVLEYFDRVTERTVILNGDVTLIR